MKSKIKIALCFTPDKALRIARQLLRFGVDVEIKTVSAKKNPKVGTRPFMVWAICQTKEDADEMKHRATLFEDYA